MKRIRIIIFLISLLCTQIAAAQYKHIFIRCEDMHGHHLIDDTIRVHQNVCFFLQPPTIAYYRVMNYDADGTNVCIQTDTHMTMLYDTEAFMGFGALKNENMDALQENMSVVLLEDVGNDRMVWSAEYSTTSLVRHSLSRGGHDAYATWVLKQHGEGWAILNEATGLYLADVPNEGDWNEGNANADSLKLRTEPHAFSLVKKENGKWTLTDAATSKTIDVALSHHDIRLYFALQILCSDVEGKTILPDKMMLIPAGEGYTQKAPTIEGYSLANTDSSLSSFDAIAENGWIEYIYQPTTTNSIAAISQEKKNNISNTIYDLFGRKVSAPQKGIYITKGQKILLP